MPVLLGLLEPKDGSDSYKDRLQIARAQLNCIRTYMYYVNKFFAAQLIKAGEKFPGYELADYINSETFALSLGPEQAYRSKPKPARPDDIPSPYSSRKGASRPYPTLVADRRKAAADRHGRPVSWVFERLEELSAGPIFVFVWDRPQPQQPLGGRTDHEAGEKRDEHFTKVDYVEVSVHYGDPRHPKAPADLRGETYVHELVIHAWRHIKYGAIDPSYRETRQPAQAKLYDLYGHHRDGVHALDDKQLPHSRADKEADLLWYYHKLREPYHPGTTRPKHPKGEFQRHIRSIGGDSLMCEKLCRMPESHRVPGPQGR